MVLCGEEPATLGLNGNLAPTATAAIAAIRARATAEIGSDLRTVIDRTRLHEAERLADQVLSRTTPQRRPHWEFLDRWSTHPVGGLVLMALVLYLLYEFVGVFGAGFLVGAMEDGLFNAHVNPAVIRATDWALPFPHTHEVDSELGAIVSAHTVAGGLSAGQHLRAFVHDFLVGEYGLVTMALTYGLAIIFPVVITFFLAFGLLEDLGYLPRVSIMVNRLFKVMGLNGQAVLPMVLGLGCDTMATVTARILPTKRERVIVTFLLALAVPCSAQLAVIMVLLQQGTGWRGVALWAAVVVVVLFAAGAAATRVLPGAPVPLVMELPPFRRPLLRNIALKTLARVEWYLKEVIPIFIVGTAALFLLDQMHALAVIQRALHPVVVTWLGLPQEGANALLMGFFRRDYGAAGFLKMYGDGQLTAAQNLVGMTTITLFVPCVANALVILKERGTKAGVTIFVLVMALAVLVGGALRLLLHWCPWLLG